MDHIQREFEDSLQRSLIRRAQRSGDDQNLFRQPWWCWGIGICLALLAWFLVIGFSLIA